MHWNRIIIVLLLAFLAGVIALSLFRSDEPDGNTPDGSFFGGLFPSGSTPAAGSTTLTLSDGGTVQVRDLTVGKTPAELGNATYYELTEGDATAEERFSITYGTDSSFSIALLMEPLSESRAAAEEYLRQKLGLSDQQLCGLYITVAVPNYVNEFYSAADVGLSFCPGATRLP